MVRKFLVVAIACCLASSAATVALAQPATHVTVAMPGSPAQLPRRVLLVVSAHGRNEGKVQPGFEMDELTQAWLVFRKNGFDVEIASPTGGGVVADSFDPRKPYNAEFSVDQTASKALSETQRLDPAMAGRYGAILVIGGKGAMFDLPFSQVLQGLLLELEGRGGVVAAVCHGPAVLARMKRTDGTSWASGRRLSGFTDEEEALFGKRWLPEFPYLLESELRRLGAQFSEAPMMLPHIAVDGRVVTGQNPYSVAATAEAVVDQMGQTPRQRTAWADERSMALIAETLAGNDRRLSAALQKKDGSIDVPLIAIWGFYRAQQAGKDPKMLGQALQVMKLVAPHLPEPELLKAIADTEAALANG